jgi:hypothetical protein
MAVLDLLRPPRQTALAVMRTMACAVAAACGGASAAVLAHGEAVICMRQAQAKGHDEAAVGSNYHMHRSARSAVLIIPAMPPARPVMLAR